MKINCNDCLGDRHSDCKNPEDCLCADNNHGNNPPKFGDPGNDPLGDTLDKIIGDQIELTKIKAEDPERYEKIMIEMKRRQEAAKVKFAAKYAAEKLFKQEPQEYEIARQEAEELEKLINNGMGDSGDSVGRAVAIGKLLITSKHLVSKIDVTKEIQNWARNYGVLFGMPLRDIVDAVFNDSDYVIHVKNISFALGRKKKNTMFGEKQLMEVSHYLMGRYHIKRIELTGTLIFFNDMYYDQSAEELIRRKSREVLIKSTNGHMNEIIKMIEDSCKLITWKDIENSVHVKCLLNGTYDIKEGVFSETFSPEHIILNQIPHNYNPMATFEEIEKKVAEIISNDNDRESYYDSLSTALHPYTGIDFQFGGVGQAGTGKSQICQLSLMALGEDNVSAAPVHLIASDLTTQKDVAFKFLNIDMDMSNETIRNIDVLKRWITQDKFTARGIYEHNTTFRPMARICFMANDLYEIASDDDAEAIYERTHVIKITNKFRGQTNVIKNLFQKIATEDQLDGFITYLLQNARDIWVNQKVRHPIEVRTVRETWNLHGNRIREFSELTLEKGVSFRVDQVEVWNRWLSYAKQKDYPSKDKKKFHQIFDEIVGNSPSKTRLGTGDDSRQVYAYSGFRLLREEEIADKQTLRLDRLDKKTEKLQKLHTFFVEYYQKNDNKVIIKSEFMELLELCQKEILS